MDFNAMMGNQMMLPGMPPGLIMGDMDMRDGGGSSQAFGGSKYAKSDSIFYKTRPCIKFEAGRCTFGDQCAYAHGEAELRKLPPEGEQILERRARMEKGDVSGASTAPTKAGESGRNLKTRLCTRFMQTGRCNYGDECKFAHGYDELVRDGPRMPMDGAAFDAFRAGMVMPGGQMLPPDFMMGGMMGMPGPIMPPRPPPGPPPSAPHPSDATDPRQTPVHSPLTEFGIYSQGASMEGAAEVSYKDRIRALCFIMGVGSKKGQSVRNAATEAAVASVRSGDAFQGNAYADHMEIMS